MDTVSSQRSIELYILSLNCSNSKAIVISLLEKNQKGFIFRFERKDLKAPTSTYTLLLSHAYLNLHSGEFIIN